MDNIFYLKLVQSITLMLSTWMYYLFGNLLNLYRVNSELVCANRLYGPLWNPVLFTLVSSLTQALRSCYILWRMGLGVFRLLIDQWWLALG